MQPFEYRSVRYWSKEINGTRTGGRKLFFNSRRSGRGRHKAAAPVESCQSVAPRSPWGCLGWLLYTRKRLHRMRHSFQHISANSLISAAHKTMISLAMASRALGGPKISACGTGDYPLPDLPPESSRGRSTPEKSAQFGPDGAPFPSKTSITRGPPVVAVAVSLDPILPHR